MASANLFLWFIQASLMLNLTVSLCPQPHSNTIGNDRKQPQSCLKETHFNYKDPFDSVKEMNCIEESSSLCTQPDYTEPATSGNSIPPGKELYRSRKTNLSQSSFKEIPDWIRDTLFYSEKEIYHIQEHSQQTDYTQLATSGNSIRPDTKMYRLEGCCPMQQYLNKDRTLTNIHNQSKKIVQFDKLKPPRYQYIMYGVCENTGNVNGYFCSQRIVNQSLLVYTDRSDIGLPIEFNLFNIPSCCFCTRSSAGLA